MRDRSFGDFREREIGDRRIALKDRADDRLLCRIKLSEPAVLFTVAVVRVHTFRYVGDAPPIAPDDK